MNRLRHQKVEGDLSDWLTLKAYANRYHYSPSQVRQLIRNGKIRGYRFRRHWLLAPRSPD